MAKKPDFDLGALTKKMNLGGIMDNVKSIMSSTGSAIEPEDGDKIGALLAHLQQQASEAAADYKAQAKCLEAIAHTASQIYAALHAEHAQTATGESTTKTGSTKASAKPSKRTTKQNDTPPTKDED